MSGKIGELRPSQFITTFGPGAVMDLPDFSVIVAGLDSWDINLCTKIEEPRLARKLGVRRFLAPPVGPSDSYEGTLPAYRFPRFLVCPECRKLGDVRKFQVDPKTQRAFCSCNPTQPHQAFPARFVVACAEGHMSDFPWHRYVHGKKHNYDCPGKDLRLNDKGVTGSIADVEVECRDCGEKRTMEDAFKENRPEILGACEGHRPWLGGRHAREKCNLRSPHLKAMLRGASNAYFAMVDSALSIPPFIDPIHQAVAALSDRLGKINSQAKLEMYIDDDVFPELKSFDPARVWEAIEAQRNLPEGDSADILFPEWEALTSGSHPGSEAEFETRVQPVPAGYKKWLDKLVMVHRLVEVRALTGFTRIDPPPDTTALMSGDQETNTLARKAPLSMDRKDWLPGLMTRGEGIFLTLQESEVARWEGFEPVKKAAATMAAALEAYCEDRNIKKELRPVFPGARYVLLHTLSHVLMRQLCLSSGYSSTALRERIYCRNTDEQKMAGILIYTATPDSEGSLGGLVELGRSEKFEELLWSALAEARLCSGDPLCAEHKPEAVGDLNGAACHACSLAAETSCERSNRFLDRSCLVPTVSTADLAFFK